MANSHNIVFSTLSGESASVDFESAADWMLSLQLILMEYDPENIFNVYETGLFFKCLPSHTFDFKGQPCFDGKHSEDRVTILVGANMDGSEKLPLLMIGKSASLHCFKNVKTKPNEYTSNKKAWMTSVLFSKWLTKLDRHFKKKKESSCCLLTTARRTTLYLTYKILKLFP